MSALVEDICNKCSSIIEKIAATRVIVQESSRRNREARVDLGDLSRQLSDLSDVLNYWKYDAVQSDAATNVVAIVSPRLGRILQHCLEVLSDVDSFAGVVEGLESWSDHMKLEIDTLYKLLDAYTLFLQVSLDMLYLIADRQDTQDNPEEIEPTVVPTVEVEDVVSGVDSLNLNSEPPSGSDQGTTEVSDVRASPGLGRKILPARSPRHSRSPSSGRV